MEMTKLFEVATRTKMRFPYKGTISTEDLWDLPLSELDLVFRTLNKQIKQVNEESLLTTRSKADKALEAQIEIVKYVFEVKTAENNARLEAREKAEKKQKLLQILASKQEEAMQNKTEAEILAELEALEA